MKGGNRPTTTTSGWRWTTTATFRLGRRLDRVVLSIARLIGRQMVREDFERLRVANDNDPGTSDAAEDGAEKD